MIYILSGGRQSGKTTTLKNWIKKEKPNVSGVLSPVIDGIRKFYALSNGETFSFSVTDEGYQEDEIIRIRKYTFLKAAFDRAIDEIKLGLTTDFGYVIIDEIGPLEMQGKGFFGIARECIDFSKKNKEIIFIVRTSLLERFIELFNLEISEYKIIDKEFFIKKY